MNTSNIGELLIVSLIVGSISCAAIGAALITLEQIIKFVYKHSPRWIRYRMINWRIV